MTTRKRIQLFPIVYLVWILLFIEAVSAQEVSSVDELRGTLEKVRTQYSSKIAMGSFDSVSYTLDVAERIASNFQPQSVMWRKRAASFLKSMEVGTDPFPEQRGDILMRGYRSRISMVLQGYAIYIPPDYDPDRAYPLMVVLHGGSANGNLFLGVVLGNNMSWKKYKVHLWDLFQPRWKPDWIVVAPDGFGQVMWRWMGEQDVLDVIDDVQQHYHIDSDRIVLGGLSNGGVGAYSIGLRHAWRFSAVTAMAGAPSWLQYAGGHPRVPEAEAATMYPLSGLSLAENAINTSFRYFHGRTDTGPMKPKFVEQFTAHISGLGVPFKETWYNTGHDILYLVHRHGRIYKRLETVSRPKKPAEIRLVSGDYRANRQHWLTLTRIEHYPRLARITAKVKGRTIRIETSNALAFSIDLREVPLATTKPPKTSVKTHLIVDGEEVYQGPHNALGHIINLAKSDKKWELGFLPSPAEGWDKRPGMSGPISDAYFDRMVHVYGTGNPQHTKSLKSAAEKGSKGWPLWLWGYRQEVISDKQVTPQIMQDAHLVLYGTQSDNQVLERIKKQLPIHILSDAIQLGSKRLTGKHVGVRFIYPNPEYPDRYVIVQAGISTEAVRAGNNLPDFLPDYVVYKASQLQTRPRLIFGHRALPLAYGYFDRYWRPIDTGRQPLKTQSQAEPVLPAQPMVSLATGSPSAAVAVDEAPVILEPALPIPPSPPEPPRPRRFAASSTDPAGKVARIIARRSRRFGRYRAHTPGGTWIVDPLVSWKIQPQSRCLEAMSKANIVGTLVEDPILVNVPSPVEITGSISGVTWKIMHDDRTLLMSCELAVRLPFLSRVLKRFDVNGVEVMSAFRERPRISYHSLGLALDIMGFTTSKGRLSVLDDFVVTPGYRTCEAPEHASRKAKTLVNIACAFSRTKKLSTILTPNYNTGHRDHFHIDARPNDPRIFMR